MKVVLVEFETRVKEIDLYFDFITDIIENEAQLLFPKKQKTKYKNIDSELTKILKANAFLLLYNLIESSLKKSIQEIYNSLNKENAKYVSVTDEIKKRWIEVNYKNFKSQPYVAEKILEIINTINEDVINMDFNASKTISGNVDSRKIKEFSTIYGFSSKTHHTTNDGNKLYVVKNKRNDLAHGTISFSDCGKEYTIEDITEIKKQVVSYMRGILKNVSKFLDEKKYLKAIA
ncbi:MAE_28990/MAE_18760 family HEPN-like nuclease [Mucilaginibacter sp. NFR10]|uniref:MAE_28990/MAE_18760 family HEPN-like nuclease n=1 Tax=Mucilaginibacter sp. NFR10 TaxID=1566292 RepID=UPI00087139F5|nr:MAE_28990/MAE_18760 family HEPN-like nuclease [Mucilaginibacter sp. NFR10]SCW41273.1 hypothetical protein SAMN03159284_00428 [Mucilaginibacter sp. NFR10]